VDVEIQAIEHLNGRAYARGEIVRFEIRQPFTIGEYPVGSRFKREIVPAYRA
jgi:hypothetical protein